MMRQEKDPRKLTSSLYIEGVGRDWVILWNGDPGEPGSKQRSRLDVIRLNPEEELALLGFLRRREKMLKDALVKEVLERAERSFDE